MNIPQGWELVLIVVVIVLLFGARKLPDAARGLGRSLRIFKAEIKNPDEPDADDLPTTTAQAPVAQPMITPAPNMPPPVATTPPPTYVPTPPPEYVPQPPPGYVAAPQPPPGYVAAPQQPGYVPNPAPNEYPLSAPTERPAER